MGRALRDSSAVLVALALLLSASGSSTLAAAAEDSPRAEYVAQVEKICHPRSDATERVVSGVRGDVQAERLTLAAGKFARAERIFLATVRLVAKVPRPAKDRATLERWFAALAKEQVYLRGIVKTLRAEDVAGFERVSAKFIQEGNRANNAVASFGFNYCAFKSTRFQ